MSKFQYKGKASISHINARKEGDDNQKELAVDVKLTATIYPPESVPPDERKKFDFVADQLDAFGDAVPMTDMLFLQGGAVRNTMLNPLTFAHELKSYMLTVLGHTMYGVKVKKFQVQPLDGYGLSLTFSVSFNPDGGVVAQLAEFLQDEIDIRLEPSDSELDLN